MAELIRLNINGKEVTGFAGQTVLEVAKENGIDIPTLCHDKRVEVYGACGLCVVEAEGSPKLLRACATTIAEGMVINTKTKRVVDSRKTALELLLSDHTGDCRPPCALNCPAGTDCQAYVGMVANGQYKEAIKIIKGVFPLPASIGHLCPHPCETACRRKYVDEPISIAYIKAFLGDKDLESDTPYMPEVAPSTGHTVAVIGGGPAGLTAAYHLRAKGHDVTIYDQMPKMGGMLRYGIPEYRLPKAVLDKEIDLIPGMGVKIIKQHQPWQRHSFEHIKNSYDAVLVSVGAWTSTKIGVKGEENANVLGGIDFLRKVALGEELVAGKNIAIVGGGNTAMDACRTAIRLGAENVYCIYRRTKAEMPAEDIEIKEAEEEGVIFKFLTNPEEVVSAADGSIECVKLQIMELGDPDASGRRSPVPVEGAIEELKVDSLIMALGQKLNPAGLEGIELTKKGTISADEFTFRTNIENVFAVGDATNKGAGIAIAAIGEAEKASHVVDSFLKGEVVPYKAPYLCERTDISEETFKDREKLPRVQMPHHTPEQRRDNFHEVNKGFSEEQAKYEASRCLECGCHDYYECKLIARANQYEVKPETFEGETHNRTIDNSHPFIDRNPDKCILCGLCVRVCDEVMGRTALGLVSRGFDTIVCPSLNQPLKETDCISCGQCINLCPTGALGEKFTYGKRVPTPSECTETTCSFCSVGCTTVLHTNENLVVKSTPADEKVLCAKGRFGYGEMLKSGRLTTPLVRKDGVLTPVSYEEAGMYIAKKMQSASVRFGKDAVAVSISDKLTTEEIYVAKKYAEEIANAGTIFCYNYRKNGVKEVLGADVSTCASDEILSANLLVLVGTDLMNDHASFGVKVRQAAKRGAKLLVLNNKPDSQEAQEADLYINTESTEGLKSILKALADKGCKAEGIEELKENLKDIVATDEAIKAAQMLIDNKKAIVIIDQYHTVYETQKAAADIAVLSGHIGSVRNGVMQLRGNANSQAVADFNLTTVCIAKETLKDVKALFVIGEDPESLETESLEFLAVADSYLTETAKKADVVLPLITFAESNGTVISMDGKVNTVKAAVKPLAKTNIEAIMHVANAMKVNFSYADEKEVMREIIEKKAFAPKAITPSLKPIESMSCTKERYNTNYVSRAFENVLKSEGLSDK